MFYVTEQGYLTVDLQGMYVMAIAFGMVKGAEKDRFAERLNELVVKEKYHLATGFLSTPFLLDVLWDCGYRETARRVLFQDTCPSWLYAVKRGATTIWECWDDRITEGEQAITSYNHYAFGTVCDFIYRKLTGLESLEPGFGKIKIVPPDFEGISFVRFRYITPYGQLEMGWEKIEERMQYTISIPHGMEAEVMTSDGMKLLGSGLFILENGRIR